MLSLSATIKIGEDGKTITPQNKLLNSSKIVRRASQTQFGIK